MIKTYLIFVCGIILIVVVQAVVEIVLALIIGEIFGKNHWNKVNKYNAIEASKWELREVMSRWVYGIADGSTVPWTSVCGPVSKLFVRNSWGAKLVWVLFGEGKIP